MSREQEEIIDARPRTGKRSRRRGYSQNGHSNGANGHSPNGYSANGKDHANGNHNGNGHAAPDSDSENPFAERRGKEIPRKAESQRRLNFEDDLDDDRAPADAIKMPFDPWRLFTAFRRRAHWLVAGAILMAGLAFLAGDRLIRYKASVNLIRRQLTDPLNPNPNDPARQQISDQTLFAFMRSGEVLRRVAAKAAEANPPIHVTPEELSKSVSVLPTANPEIITLSVAGHTRSQRLADLVNIYADQVVHYTRDIQASESGDVAGYLEQRLQLAENDWRAANEELSAFEKQGGFFNLDKESGALADQISNYEMRLESARVDLNTARLQREGLEKDMAKQSPKNDKLKTAREDLANLLLKYTEAHPAVIEQRKKIEMLSKQEPSLTDDGTQVTGSSFGNALYLQTMELKNREAAKSEEIKQYQRLYDEAKAKLRSLNSNSSKYVELKAKVQSAEATRKLLADHQRDARLFVENAMGYYRRAGEASAKDIDWKRRAMKISAITIIGGITGFILATLLAFLVEASDTSLKTISDIERVTGLRVLAKLGDLKKMSPEQKNRWAFRTLTTLRGHLCENNEQALVFGIISSRPREGRSTWVEALAMAARQQGLKTELCDPSQPVQMEPVDLVKKATGQPDSAAPEDSARKEPIITPPPGSAEAAQPKELALTTLPHESRALVPISDLAWTVEGRKQWQEELAARSTKKHSVILIDLPPASREDSVLLAQEIPQIIWLVGSGMADVQETREQLDILRNAHCNIVGAVLNHAPPPALNNRFTRWFKRGAAMLFFALGLCGIAHAQEPQQPAKEQRLAFSGTAEIKRAKWQQRLTLGPGDSMDISIYGHPDLMRTNIFVGPDGRISYLQIQGLRVEGMTIEELRARMDEELAKYFNAARTIIIPTAFNSKKYYVLGKVNSKGVYALDRPMTVIEAVARAQGLETGLYERNTVEMADLSRSFLIRNGQQEKIDFEKLFYEGDLSQNVMIEPNDFLFFGAAAAREIYVLGQVANPGPVGYIGNATVLTAITDRGGFTDRAYKGRVLVVRGSINKPQTFVVQTKDILEAKATDFKLESRDIVYVSARPWIRAEELLNDATESFIQGFVTAFSGAKIGPFIKHPIFGD
jgi:protein involved in polysaccharide export with SLBB domain/uncharacterized protein involved in exopolysaccharide biosynthesis/Mrp family chromosome partitioning ATPase